MESNLIKFQASQQCSPVPFKVGKITKEITITSEDGLATIILKEENNGVLVKKTKEEINRNPYASKEERNAAIRKEHRAGRRQVDIASDYGLSQQRVSQILAED